MPRTAFLHVGMPKAASTSIQMSLFGYEGPTARYAGLPRDNHSIIFFTLFNQRDQVHRTHRQQGRSPEWIAETKARWQAQFDATIAQDTRDVVFSGEVLYNLREEELMAIRERLLQDFDEVKAIAYARRPGEFANSEFQQRLKYWAHEFKVRTPAYKRDFQKLINVFGREHLSVKLLAPEYLHNGNAVEDICVQMGIDPATVEVKRGNESLCAEVVAMLYMWNRDGFKSSGVMVERQSLTKMVKDHLPKVKGRKLFFHPDLINESLNEKAVLWLEKTFDLDCTETLKSSDEHLVIRYAEDLLDLAAESTHLLQPVLEDAGLAVPEHYHCVGHLNALYAKIMADQYSHRARRSDKSTATPEEGSEDEAFLDEMDL